MCKRRPSHIKCFFDNCSHKTQLYFTLPLISTAEYEYKFKTRQVLDPEAGRAVVEGSGTFSDLDKKVRFLFIATFRDNRDGTLWEDMRLRFRTHHLLSQVLLAGCNFSLNEKLYIGHFYNTRDLAALFWGFPDFFTSPNAPGKGYAAGSPLFVSPAQAFDHSGLYLLRSHARPSSPRSRCRRWRPAGR